MTLTGSKPCPRCGLPLAPTGHESHGFGDCPDNCWCYGACWSEHDRGACWTPVCPKCQRLLDTCPHGTGGLHLTRKFGQHFWIDDACVTLQPGPSAGQVRVQVQAPEHVRIMRDELLRGPRKGGGT